MSERFEYRPFYGNFGSENPRQVIEVLVAELGQLGLGLRGAPRERTRLRNRGESRPVGAAWASAARRLRGHGVFAALGKNLFDLGVRAGNDVD